MTVLMQATNQWSSRPDDERFKSLEDLHSAATDFRTTAAVARIKANALRVAADHNELLLIGQNNNTATLNSWSFGQVAERAHAPAGYLKQLPASIAADCINDGLMKRADDAEVQLLLNENADKSLSARAVTSDKYSRIWNTDITKRLLDLAAGGVWQPAPAAFDGSRGLYLGDRDMFAFLVDNERRIFETLPGGGLSRGFFTSNSEVGDGAFNIWTFLYEYVCGNHRVWGVKNVENAKVIHIGKDQGSKAFATMQVEVAKYAEASAADDEAKIESARTFQLGATKDEVLDAIFKMKLGSAVTKQIAFDAYDLAEKRVDWYGSPRSAWGYAGGLTEIARDKPNANDRHALDSAATKVMEIAF